MHGCTDLSSARHHQSNSTAYASRPSFAAAGTGQGLKNAERLHPPTSSKPAAVSEWTIEPSHSTNEVIQLSHQVKISALKHDLSTLDEQIKAEDVLAA